MGSSSFKSSSRLFNGFSMVAKEAVRRSDTLNAIRDQDFQSLIKKVVVSATDFCGLTEGTVREFSNPVSSTRESNVFFGDSNPDAVSDSMGEVQSAPDRVVDKTSSIGTECLDLPRGPLAADVENCNDASQSACSSQNSDHVDSISTECGKRKAVDIPVGNEVGVVQQKRWERRERRVPSTPFFRAVGFAGLGAGLAWGTIQESAKRLVFGTPNPPDNQSVLSPFLSEQNGKRLALALCRMRGAALKIGQMLSIQDETLVPAPILAALDIVRQGADVMPRSQLNQVLDTELGKDWTSRLTSFDYEPIAAASIGQVHRAVTKDGLIVAMKIQYPGVANSIESDIENVKLLLDYTNLIPEGLFLDQAIKVAKKELSCECDYDLESDNQKRFRNLLSNIEGFYVPAVIDNLSTKKVLTTELVSGIPIDKVAQLSQDVRDFVGKKLLELTLMELFVFRFMQTDPNWGNFLYEESTRTINLIDFGAARDYPKPFVDDYLRMVVACSNGERDGVIEMSRRLGFLTGTESDVMLDAHVQAGFVVGLPFSKPGSYDFGSSNITQSISNLGARMLKHRVKPPPDEAYSLHRKLSGAFLACIKLSAVVSCREILLHVYEHYQFDEPTIV